MLAEVDPGQLSRAERGLAGVSLPALARIAVLLKVSLAELVDPEYNPSSPQADSITAHIEYITNKIWDDLKTDQLEQCRPAELNLIQHHIRSAIEEGIKRGEVEAEREIEIILNQNI